MKTPFFIILIACMAALCSCSSSGSRQVALPAALDDGWKVCSPAEVGLDQTLVARAAELCRRNGKVDAFLLARNGKLVADEYFNGYNATSQHKAWSVTKSVTSMLIGIAIDKGFIRSADDSLYRHLDTSLLSVHADKGYISIKHLLSMTSGIAWTELGGPAAAGYRMAYATDWVDFVSGLPLQHTPGEVFNYSTGNYILLSAVLKSATGSEATDFAREHLFQPLGIKNYEWATCAEFWTKTEGGELPSARKPDPPLSYQAPFSLLTNTGSGLSITPRDMLKLGQLYLDGGKWNGTQIVSADWVKASVSASPQNNYGYSWRRRNFTMNDTAIPCFYAHGFGGQVIYIIPSAQMVLVITQGNYRDMRAAEEVITSVIEQCLLPAEKDQDPSGLKPGRRPQ